MALDYLLSELGIDTLGIDISDDRTIITLLNMNENFDIAQ